jgi:hypothetical protein
MSTTTAKTVDRALFVEHVTAIKSAARVMWQEQLCPRISKDRITDRRLLDRALRRRTSGVVAMGDSMQRTSVYFGDGSKTQFRVSGAPPVPKKKIVQAYSQHVATSPTDFFFVREPYTSQMDPKTKTRLQKVGDVRAGHNLRLWIASNRKRRRRNQPELPPPDGTYDKTRFANSVRGLLRTFFNQSGSRQFVNRDGVGFENIGVAGFEMSRSDRRPLYLTKAGAGAKPKARFFLRAKKSSAGVPSGVDCAYPPAHQSAARQNQWYQITTWNSKDQESAFAR